MKSQLIFDDLLQIRAPGVCFYVLRDESGLFLIDAGFVGGLSCLEAGLEYAGWENERIQGILLTHGHLDHILNVKKLARVSGAWIAAPIDDQLHCQGLPRYRGLSRLVGSLEAIGRKLLGFKAFTAERELPEGTRFDIWHGLEVVHLPGHTEGHSGFYCAARKLLFCGDLFASFGAVSHFPPPLFNESSVQNRESIRKALALELVGVLPNHCDRSTPEAHLEQLRRLHEKASLRKLRGRGLGKDKNRD